MQEPSFALLVTRGCGGGQVLALLLGGGLTLSGIISDKQLTSYVLYAEFVASASLSVCDQVCPLPPQ